MYTVIEKKLISESLRINRYLLFVALPFHGGYRTALIGEFVLNLNHII
jgi:hypothetical protein